MSTDDLKNFRIRQPNKSGRRPPAGPDVEGKILDAAEFVFGHFGFRGATTALIAKKAQIAKPHIYYYFEDKEDLYRAVLERAMNMWARDMESIETAGDIQTILVRYIEKKVDFSRDHPDLSRLYANEITSGAPFIRNFIEKVSTPLLLTMTKSIDSWAAARKIRPVSGPDLFFCIWAMTQHYADFASQMALMKGKRALDQSDYDAAKATIVQLVLGGLGLTTDERPADADRSSKTIRPSAKRTRPGGA
jgi:TetR/AcrR family transcriptional regulator